MFSEGIQKNELLWKSLKDAPFQSYFKIFSIVTLVYWLWPIILQNFKRILWVNSQSKVYQVLGLIPGKNALFMGQRESSKKIHNCHLYLLYLSTFMHNFRKIPNVGSKNDSDSDKDVRGVFGPI